ncbi:MAG: zinc ribbon domain-containing protein [Chloroflexaceae bacterium]
MKCPSCGAEGPDDALFCIECGVSLRPVTTGATTVLPGATADARICGVCGAANPPHAAYCVRCGTLIKGPAPIPGVNMPERLARSTEPLAPPPAMQRAGPGREIIGLAVFLIGFGGLMLARVPIWPAILFVIGMTVFAVKATSGRIIEGLFGIIWLFGLGVLFTVPRLFWPGVLVLIGLTVLLDVLRRTAGRP